MPRKRGPKPSRAATSPTHGKHKGSSKMVAWNKRSDIPLDDEEQFHLSRDRILLEGEEEGHDSDGDEEEVFSLQGLDDSEDTDDNQDHVDDVGDDDSVDEDAGSRPVPSKTSSKRKSKTKVRGSDAQSSGSEEDEESWGKKKSAYYSSNMDQLESDDDEANEMEEEEARRLQAKLRSTMTEQDFGLDDLLLRDVVEVNDADDFWQQAEEPSQKSFQVEKLSDRVSVLQHLQKANPEALALALEWDDVVHSAMKTERKIANLDTVAQDPSVLGMIHLHHQTQLMYASLLAFYLHLRSSEKYAARPDTLRTHPIMRRLLTLKQGLAELEELDFDLSDDGESELSDDMDDDSSLWRGASKYGLDASELADLLKTAHSSPKNENKATKIQTRKVGMKDSVKEQQSATSKVEPVYDLVEPTFVKSKKPSQLSTKTRTNDLYGEATSLDSADVADKTVRKKALRFHTSKIESSSIRRQNARNALGGDDDIPYRERKKQQAEKAVRKNLGTGGDDLDDEDPEQRDNGKKRARVDEEGDSGSDGDEGEDGYYSLVKKQKVDKKAEKKARYEAEVKAAKGVFDEDVTDGQRSVTRAIMANKGLTPHRSKSVRNPRVKKRQRFEKAKKKVSSQKAVFKGGIGDVSRYGGEDSGITKVVKSVKF